MPSRAGQFSRLLLHTLQQKRDRGTNATHTGSSTRQVPSVSGNHQVADSQAGAMEVYNPRNPASPANRRGSVETSQSQQFQAAPGAADGVHRTASTRSSSSETIPEWYTTNSFVANSQNQAFNHHTTYVAGRASQHETAALQRTRLKMYRTSQWKRSEQPSLAELGRSPTEITIADIIAQREDSIKQAYELAVHMHSELQVTLPYNFMLSEQPAVVRLKDIVLARMKEASGLYKSAYNLACTRSVSSTSHQLGNCSFKQGLLLIPPVRYITWPLLEMKSKPFYRELISANTGYAERELEFCQEIQAIWEESQADLTRKCPCPEQPADQAHVKRERRLQEIAFARINKRLLQINKIIGLLKREADHSSISASAGLSS